MRKFFYLMAMVCTLGFFTACSSDDDPTIWDTFKGGDFQVWGDALDIDEDDVENHLVDYKINVSRVDDTKAKVVINATAEGINVGTITVPEALIQQKGTDVVISGEGTAVMAGDKAETKATANIDDNTEEKAKVTLTISSDNKASLEYEMDGNTYKAANDQKPASASIIGTWETWFQWYNSDGEIDGPSEDGGGDEYALGSVKLNWEAKEGTTITIPLDPSMPDNTMPFPVETASALAERMANKELENTLKSVSFTSDGKILAVYSDEETNGKPVWKVAKNYATYKEISDNKIEVYLNDEQILSTVEDATEKAVLKTILDIFKEGIPVNVEYSNQNKTAFFYVDKDFASTLASNPVLAGLVKNLKNEDLDGMGFMIKSICNQIPGLMENTNKFQAGLELNKN